MRLLNSASGYKSFEAWCYVRSSLGLWPQTIHLLREGRIAAVTISREYPVLWCSVVIAGWLETDLGVNQRRVVFIKYFNACL